MPTPDRDELRWHDRRRRSAGGGVGGRGRDLALPKEGKPQIAVIYLVAATVGLFSLVLFVVQRWTASATSYVSVVMPIVAVALGALIADEEITVTTVLGGAVVCAGVYVGALARRS